MSSISRRDFFNGVALTIAAGLTPAMQGHGEPGRRYPPALTGLRGQHEGSFETAHAQARGHRFASDRLPVEERYDLVVVGAGISGLAAAWFYRRARPRARILILDNHDDFGGHARRNEFTIDGRLIIGYGGSEFDRFPQDALQQCRQGSAAGPRRRDRAVRERIRSDAIFLARTLARHVLRA